MKPRVFVSSVIEGFKECRDAARRAITSVGGEPILVENFPSLSISPRNACLDGVIGSDIFLLIIGDRGGYKAPSGKLVVEEEYEEAVKRKLKIFVFIQKTEQDEDAKKLAAAVSDYVHGVFRLTFSSAQELESSIEKSLKPAVKQCQNQEVDMQAIQEKLQTAESICAEACLRFVISPERIDEHIDPIKLESNDLRDKLLGLGHAPKIRIFSYENPKETDVGINEIIISQTSEGRGRDCVDVVRVELSVEGCFVIDLNISGLSKDEDHLSLISMVVLESDIIHRLNKCFAFVGAYFESIDSAERYDRMYYNAALYQSGYRNLVSAPPKGNSISMGLDEKGSVPAFERPRLITRRQLLDYGNEVEAALVMFRRRLKKR